MKEKNTINDDELYAKLTEDRDIEPYSCKFKSNNSERFCNATSHASCDGCRFFMPTSQAKLKLFTEKIQYLSDMMSKLIDENKRLFESVEIERENNRELRKENNRLQEEKEQMKRAMR